MPSSRQQQPAAKSVNEGEGSRTAAHRYEQGVKRTVQSGHVEEKARGAARALDGPEGAALRGAEAAAKNRPSPAGRVAQGKPKKH